MKSDYVRPLVVLGGLFVVSVVALLLAYSDGSQFGLRMAWDEVPVLRLAALLTLLCPATLGLAFWESRGGLGRFENAAIGWSLLGPPVFVMLLVPTRASEVVRLTEFELFVGIVIASQMGATRLLQSWFWARGSRVG